MDVDDQQSLALWQGWGPHSGHPGWGSLALESGLPGCTRKTSRKQWLTMLKCLVPYVTIFDEGAVWSWESLGGVGGLSCGCERSAVTIVAVKVSGCERLLSTIGPRGSYQR